MKKNNFFFLILLVCFSSLTFAFDEALTPTGKTNPSDSDSKDFQKAMVLWNNHKWDEAEKEFIKFLEKYPDSPWAAEAAFHLGCLSDYRKDYTKAKQIFKQLIEKHKDTPFANKSRIRLAGVLCGEGSYNESISTFKEIIENNPTPNQFKYSFAWYRKLKKYQQASKTANLCGPKTLAYCLNILNKPEGAKKLDALTYSEKPYSFADLIKLAKDYQVKAYGVKLTIYELRTVPKPIILYLKDRKHFVVLKEVQNSFFILHDPFEGEIKKSSTQLKKEWNGEALIFTLSGLNKKILLSTSQLEKIQGGCCGRPRPVPDLGPCVPGQPMVSGPGCSNCGSGGGREPNQIPILGANPKLQINSASLNLILEETPVGYQPAIGPGVYLTLTYNTDDPETGIFGNSWSSPWEARIFEQPDNSVVVVEGNGNQLTYTYNNGSYSTPAGYFSVLIKNPDNTFTLTKKSGTKLHFGNNQKISKIEDKNGNYISFTYDSEDKLVEVIDAVGRITSISYGTNGKVSQVTDPIGRTAYFEYDSAGNLVSIIDVGGYTLSFVYDVNNNLISYTTPLGTTNISYEMPFWEQYKITVTDAQGNQIQYLWDGSMYSMGANIVTTPSGAQTWYYVDWNNVVNQISTPSGTTFYTYNENRLLTQKTDPKGYTYYYTYDTRGNLTAVTDPLNNTTYYQYDSNDNITQIRDANNNITTFSYDTRGNLISKTDPLNKTYSYTYDTNGKLVSVTDQNNNTTIYQYDTYGNLIKIIDPAQYQTTFTYDAIGRKISQTDAKGRTTYFSYDNLDRITQITYPDNTSVSYTYSCCGVLSMTDQLGRQTNYTYNNLGQLIKVTDANNNQTNYTYDSEGRLISITDASNNTTTFTYDAAGRLIRKTYPDNTYEAYQYDANNNLIKKIKPDGTTINYTYDALNRIIEIKIQ